MLLVQSKAGSAAPGASAAETRGQEPQQGRAAATGLNRPITPQAGSFNREPRTTKHRGAACHRSVNFTKYEKDKEQRERD